MSKDNRTIHQKVGDRLLETLGIATDCAIEHCHRLSTEGSIYCRTHDASNYERDDGPDDAAENHDGWGAGRAGDYTE